MPKKRVTIRRLQEADLGPMVDVWMGSGLSFKPRGRDKMSSLRTQRAGSPDLFLGAFAEGRLVGAVIASDDGRRGWINRLAVLPEVRRMGVAKALIKAAEDALRKRGRHLFCVHVDSDNELSMGLLEKAGYTREKEIFYYAKRERKSY
jgi:ribosomal protein S18 acetylase RimI-like enzyme